MHNAQWIRKVGAKHMAWSYIC